MAFERERDEETNEHRGSLKDFFLAVVSLARSLYCIVAAELVFLLLNFFYLNRRKKL